MNEHQETEIRKNQVLEYLKNNGGEARLKELEKIDTIEIIIESKRITRKTKLTNKQARSVVEKLRNEGKVMYPIKKNIIKLV